MRTGWSDSDLAVENALAAESAGVSALAMHGRTREQMYTGHCDHETLARVAKAITKIPFIGNGDVRSVQDAKLMIEELGVDAVIGGSCMAMTILTFSRKSTTSSKQERSCQSFHLIRNWTSLKTTSNAW